MAKLSRRIFLSGTAAAGAAAAVSTTEGAPAIADGLATVAGGPGPVTVPPSDPRYADLVWGANHRWVGAPDYVRLVGSTGHVVDAVGEAVAAGKRISVRSGGHCYENFVSHPDVRVVIDMSRMNRVYYDPRLRAFAVEAGATLGEAYEALYKDWGVTIPGGSCPTVGIGGHIAGGGYGPLSRRHGLTVDHLYAVEVVVVGADGRARAVVATRESGDPNRDLWWAHTGGGGGNFGVVTRYWFRSPGATGADPARLLPAPPAEVLVRRVAWPWAALTESSFKRVLRNFGTFYERNSAPDSPYTGMFSQLMPQHMAAGAVAMATVIDARMPDAERLLDDYHAAIDEGTGGNAFAFESRRLSWLHAVTRWPGLAPSDVTLRYKGKSAYMRKGFSETAIDAYHRHLTRSDYANQLSMVILFGFGGKIGTVAPSATAVAQRDSVIKAHYVSFWTNPAEDATHVGWLRQLYADAYADTGGVPVPNEFTDGCYVNYPDVDLGDPAWNTSTTSWQTLYYKQNYPRLQAVKARWDPRNIFRHAQSITP